MSREDEDGERRLEEKKMKARGEKGSRLGKDRVLGLGLGFIVFLVFFKIAPYPSLCVL